MRSNFTKKNPPNTFVRKIIRDYFRSQKIQGLSFLLVNGTARSADLDGFFKLFPKCAQSLVIQLRHKQVVINYRRLK